VEALDHALPSKPEWSVLLWHSRNYGSENIDTPILFCSRVASRHNPPSRLR
jgi:hypothetical protein